MPCNDWIRDWPEILNDPILVDSELNAEALGNCWHLPPPSKDMSCQDVSDFLGIVMDNRREQISRGIGPDCMTFYVWFDWQAGQLCFSLISGCDRPLPFGAPIDKKASLTDIIQTFLESPYLHGIPLSEFREVTAAEILASAHEDPVLPPLKVFATCLEPREPSSAIE